MAGFMSLEKSGALILKAACEILTTCYHASFADLPPNADVAAEPHLQLAAECGTVAPACEAGQCGEVVHLYDAGYRYDHTRDSVIGLNVGVLGKLDIAQSVLGLRAGEILVGDEDQIIS